MNRIALCFGFVMLGNFVAQQARGAACATASLATYLALDGTGCTIGDKLFSDFAFSPTATGGATAPDAAGITVTPVTLGNGDIGLSFNSLWFAGSGQLVDTTIDFTVAIVGGGGFLIKDASTVQSSSGFTGTGAATVTEGLCVVGTTTCFANTSTVNTQGTSVLSSNVVFSPIGAVRAHKDIGVAGGSAGTASISAVQDTFSQTAVPEPMSILLLGTMLVGVAGIARRRCAS